MNGLGRKKVKGNDHRGSDGRAPTRDRFVLLIVLGRQVARSHTWESAGTQRQPDLFPLARGRGRSRQTTGFEVKKMNSTQPTAKFRAGPISCALWQNNVEMNGRNVVLMRATVERRYKDRSNQWQSSGSFGRNDIPLVIWCLQKAFESMLTETRDEDEVEA